MNNYLYHHGILGQKWGVRRFQNKDGTLTEAGKKRYRVKEQQKILAKKAFKAAHTPTTERAIKSVKKILSERVRESLTKEQLQEYKKLSEKHQLAYDKWSQELEKTRDRLRPQVEKKMIENGFSPYDNRHREYIEAELLEKDPKLEKLTKQAFEAAKEHNAFTRKIAEEFVGDFGKMRTNDSWAKYPVSVTDYVSLQLTGTLHDLLNDHEWQGK